MGLRHRDGDGIFRHALSRRNARNPAVSANSLCASSFFVVGKPHRGLQPKDKSEIPDESTIPWCVRVRGTAGDGFRGMGAVKPTRTQGIATLKRQAPAGIPPAQNSLGRAYDLGQGVPQDYAQAASWYRGAAEQGIAAAQYRLAVLYAKGKGVPQDYKEAVHWTQKAAQQDYAPAEYSLGFSYHVGEGSPRDYAKAVFWYRKPGEQGNPDAQYCLGMLQFGGQGAPQDYAESYFWLDIAASENVADVASEDVAKLRDTAASELTKTVLLQTQERARRCLEDNPAKPP